MLEKGRKYNIRFVGIPADNASAHRDFFCDILFEPRIEPFIPFALPSLLLKVPLGIDTLFA